MTPPTLTYYNDAGKLTSMTLTPNQLYLSSIIEYAASDSVSYLINGTDRTEFDGEYTISNDNKFNNFTIEMNNFVSYRYDGYKLKYKLNASQLGLSETEIQKIQAINFNKYTRGSDGLNPGYQHINITAENEQTVNNYSYFEFAVSDGFDAKSTDDEYESKSISLTMRKNTNIFKNTSTVTNNVVNINPVFFVKLPSEFDYKNIKVTPPTNSDIKTKTTFTKGKDGERYLVIKCDDTTYDSSETSASRTITVTLDRKLKKHQVSSGTLYAYMLTDNENYYYKANNSNQFKKGDTIPESIFIERLQYGITGESEVAAHTYVTDPIDKNEYEDYQKNWRISRMRSGSPPLFGTADLPGDGAAHHQ